MAFDNNFDGYSWNNSGSEPTAELMQNGYQERYHPPAGIFNWFWNKVIACIKEIQKKLNINTISEGDDDNIRYEYRADNSLHIFGVGAMPAHTNETAYAWYEYNSTAREIYIHNGITSIPSKAFKGFGKVVEMELSNSITTIGNNAFEGCLTLRHLHLPLSLTSLGDNAFKGCSRLTALSIPVTVTSIGNSAFVGCSAISHVCYEGTASQFSSITIGTGNELLTNADIYYTTHCITDSDALMMRDKNGRCKISAPVDDGDIANKAYVNSLFDFGVYTGDGTTDREINLGFRPKAVLVITSNGQMGGIPNGDIFRLYGGLALDGYAVQNNDNKAEITANGFTVSGECNQNNTSYYYIAIESTKNIMVR